MEFDAPLFRQLAGPGGLFIGVGDLQQEGFPLGFSYEGDACRSGLVVAHGDGNAGVFGHGGLAGPTGITFVAKSNREAFLLQIAYAYEQATRARKLPE